MDKVKCECGHINHYGTVICESCGKPLNDEEDNKELLNMRYEGTARRSQTYNATIIDKIWNFFSSVKVGIWIIVILLVTSSFGTIFPQQLYIPSNVPPGVYYKDEYGVLGQIYYQLGFHNLYGSWWYMLLMAGLGISLIICSVDRVVPLYRALKIQKVTRHEAFLSRQRVFGKSKVENEDRDIEKAKEILINKKYKISEENGNIVAEKGRFSRWGPYVNHIGLILFLIGCMFRFFPGMYVDEHLWVRDGETRQIPGTQGEYYLKNHQFSLIMYDENDERFKDAAERQGGMLGAVQAYQTEATLFKRVDGGTVGSETELEEVDHQFINVNHPFKFDSFALYQVDYKLNELNELTFTLIDKETEDKFGDMVIDLFDPQSHYELGNGYEVEVMNYFPDFIFKDSGEPSTKSKIPDNPAFIFKVTGPDIEEEVSVVGINMQVEPFGDNKYGLFITDLTTKNVTALTVRKDLTLPFLFVGGFIFMFGLVQGMYWHHRRIWIQRKNGEVWIAGHANKNWHSLKSDIESIVKETNLTMPIDQVELKEKKNGVS